MALPRSRSEDLSLSMVCGSHSANQNSRIQEKKMPFQQRFILGLVLAGLTGALSTAHAYQKTEEVEDQVSIQNSGAVDEEDTTYLQQNWTPDERETFYRTAQGSLVMPLKFAKALEAKDGTPFFSNENLKKYGFIPQKESRPVINRPLPIGFTVDGWRQHTLFVGSSDRGERYLGVNCSLCHTNAFHFNNKALRIDGGQTLANFQVFIRTWSIAVKATVTDQAKLSLVFEPGRTRRRNVHEPCRPRRPIEANLRGTRKMDLSGRRTVQLCSFGKGERSGNERYDLCLWPGPYRCLQRDLQRSSRT